MTQLALVLGGSASLGAYSGGALDEVFRALRRDGRRGVEVGVVTGASSGAIAAALGARATVVNPSLLPWAEKFWRRGLRDELLLDADRADRSGWLSAAPLEELLGELVAGDPAADDGAAGFLGEQLALGFALQRLGPAPSTTAGRPGEEVVFRLNASHGAGHEVWGRVLDAALAGASLPLAFPPRVTAGLGLDEAEGGPRVGDGLATERPLALARRLALGHPASDRDWRFLVVAPGLAAGDRPDEHAVPTEVADVARAFVRSAAGRGMALDLLRAADEEERSGLLRDLVTRLPDIHGRLDDPEAVGLGRRVGELAERVAEWEVERGAFRSDSPDPVLDHLDRELARIQERGAYAAAFDEVEGRAGSTRMAKLVYVLEAVAGLRGRQDQRVHLIAPEGDRPLAGEAMAGLGGWFSSAARESDFAAGRRDARRVLEGGLSDAVSYEPEADAADPAAGGGFSMTSAERDRLRAFLAREVDRRLDGLAPSGLRGLFFGWARPAVRRRAVDRLFEALNRS